MIGGGRLVDGGGKYVGGGASEMANAMHSELTAEPDLFCVALPPALLLRLVGPLEIEPTVAPKSTSASAIDTGIVAWSRMGAVA